MKTQAIIPTAGVGQRLKAPTIKPLVLLHGKPIFIRTLEVFEKSLFIDSVILAAPKDYFQEFEKAIKEYHLHKVVRIVAGGVKRCDSVRNALQIIDKDTEVVVVHDGVRPLVTEEIIEQSVKLCEAHEAVVTAVPMKPTIKKVSRQDFIVEKTIRRDDLWEVQTPQTFRRDTLWEAYEMAKTQDPTDDAMLVEALGVPVKILEGDYTNIKITTAEDLTIAESFLNSRS